MKDFKINKNYLAVFTLVYLISFVKRLPSKAKEFTSALV